MWLNDRPRRAETSGRAATGATQGRLPQRCAPEARTTRAPRCARAGPPTAGWPPTALPPRRTSARPSAATPSAAAPAPRRHLCSNTENTGAGARAPERAEQSRNACRGQSRNARRAHSYYMGRSGRRTARRHLAAHSVLSSTAETAAMPSSSGPPCGACCSRRLPSAWVPTSSPMPSSCARARVRSGQALHERGQDGSDRSWPSAWPRHARELPHARVQRLELHGWEKTGCREQQSCAVRPAVDA